MDPRIAARLAHDLQQGRISVEEFVQQLRAGHTADLQVAQVDLDRRRRCGYPEVVYAEGKPLEALLRICEALTSSDAEAFATRVSAEQAAALQARFPQGRHNPIARTFRISASQDERKPYQGRIVIVTAGTTDLPVAEEARETADWMNVQVDLIQDVGVAGPHRLPAHLETLERADAIVVIAGMEGALPSVVGGYVSCPVIAVPTSVGYGASFGGVTALLGMLNSCASNVAVVNIDSGFKGAYLAGLIATNAERRRKT
jgi:NCAIR mutase (PurE)-related protein